MTDETHHSAFPLGRIVATPGAQEALAASHQDPGQFLDVMSLRRFLCNPTEGDNHV